MTIIFDWLLYLYFVIFELILLIEWLPKCLNLHDLLTVLKLSILKSVIWKSWVKNRTSKCVEIDILFRHHNCQLRKSEQFNY